MSMEGFGPDSVFSTLAEDNGQYRISRSLVRSAEGSTVPLTRVKCLVSMTTPHDIRLHGSAVTPAFVEFDASLEGFGSVGMNIYQPETQLCGCLYIVIACGCFWTLANGGRSHVVYKMKFIIPPSQTELQPLSTSMLSVSGTLQDH